MRTIRAVLVSALLILLAFVAFGYWGGNASWRFARPAPSQTVGTSGAIDVNVARERGAEAGEKLAVVAEKMKETAAEAALTTKIKAKMVLDDSVKARSIDVTTHGSTVTLSGTVRSGLERERAVSLARETTGVTRVVDQMRIEM